MSGIERVFNDILDTCSILTDLVRITLDYFTSEEFLLTHIMSAVYEHRLSDYLSFYNEYVFRKFFVSSGTNIIHNGSSVGLAEALTQRIVDQEIVAVAKLVGNTDVLLLKQFEHIWKEDTTISNVPSYIALKHTVQMAVNSWNDDEIERYFFYANPDKGAFVATELVTRGVLSRTNRAYQRSVLGCGAAYFLIRGCSSLTDIFETNAVSWIQLMYIQEKFKSWGMVCDKHKPLSRYRIRAVGCDTLFVCDRCDPSSPRGSDSDTGPRGCTGSTGMFHF